MHGSEVPDAESQRRHLLQRLGVLEAVIIAIDRRDELMQILATAVTVDEACRELGTSFGLNDAQAHAVLDLQVRRFAGQERQRIIEERDSVRAELSPWLT